MRKIICIFVFLFLSACASNQKNGYFLEKEDINLADSIITDSIAMFKKEYPPANTLFSLENHEIFFGDKLIDSLRTNGYSVTLNKEYNSVSLKYVIDTVDGIYRVSYYIGEDFFSRGYVIRENKFYPAGSWSKLVGADK